jgi:hypothetical protein
MYVSDQRTSNFLAILALLAGPWLGVSREAWGWMLDVLLLLSVFWIGRKEERGFQLAATFLALGYLISLVFNGVTTIDKMGFIPCAGLFTIWATKEKLPQGSTVFWSLCLAGLAGSIPALISLHQGIPQDTVQGLIQGMLEQYRQTGILDAFKQQGITEIELKSLLERTINVIILVTPGLASVLGLFVWGAVYYFFARWFPEPGRKYRPFTQWRIPWYAVWGMNLAVASYLLGDQFLWLALRSFGINLMLVYGVIAVVLGSAIFIHYLKSPFLSNFLKFLLIFTSFIYIQVTVVGLALLGLFDLVLNFRRLPDPDKGLNK